MGRKEKESAGTNGEGKALGKKQLARRIQALTAQVTYLESSLAATDRRTGKLTAKLTKRASAGDTVGALEADLAATRVELNAMAQRLDGMEAAQFQDRRPGGVEERIDKLEQIEPRLSVLGGDLEQYRLEQSTLASKIEELKEHDGRRELSLRYTTERAEALSERDAQLEKALSTTQDRLDDLETALDTTGTTLDSMQEENSTREEKVTGLVFEIEGLRESDEQREQQLQDTFGWIERVSVWDEQLENALSAAQDRLQELEVTLDMIGSTLDSVQKENCTREEKITGLVSEIEGLRESDGQRQQQLRDISDRVERVSERDEPLEKALGATENRLDDLETALDKTGTTLDSMREENSTRGEEITGLVSEIEGLRESDGQREQQLQETYGWIERVSERDGQLEKALGATEDRLNDLDTALDTAGTTFDSMREENSAREEKVTGLVSEIEGLREFDGQRQQQLRDISDRVERVSERDEQLEKALGATENRLNDLDTALDTAGTTFDSMREENSTREEKVSGVQSGLRTLAWSGAAALVALTAGTLVFVNKQQTDREAIENELNIVEQRLSGATDGHQEVADLQAQVRTLNTRFDALPQDDDETRKQALVNRMVGYDQRQSQLADRLNLLEQRLSDTATEDSNQVRRLSEGMADPHSVLTTLSSRIGDLPQDESTTPDATLADRMAAYDRDQSRIMESLDDLGERLAQIESQTAPSVGISAPTAEEPLIPPASEPELQEGKTDRWKAASEQRRYTIQLLGVRNRPSLLEFARRYHLLADSALLETEHQGEPWFVLFHGIYESRSQAAKTVRELSPTLSRAKPWVRRLPRGGNIEALEPTP